MPDETPKVYISFLMTRAEDIFEFSPAAVVWANGEASFDWPALREIVARAWASPSQSAFFAQALLAAHGETVPLGDAT